MSTCTTNSQFYNHIKHSCDEYIVIRSKPVEEAPGFYVIADGIEQIEDLLWLIISADPVASWFPVTAGYEPGGLLSTVVAALGMRNAVIEALVADMPWAASVRHEIGRHAIRADKLNSNVSTATNATDPGQMVIRGQMIKNKDRR
jgi:hypothetical protein